MSKLNVLRTAAAVAHIACAAGYVNRIMKSQTA